MENQMSQREQAIWNTDFENMENHYFSRTMQIDYYTAGFGYSKVYQSPAMVALGWYLWVNIDSIVQVSYKTWHISYDCFIRDDYWSFKHKFKPHSLVHDESYINAWTSHDPGHRSRDAYDILFSQLDEEKLYEECMEYIKSLGLEEQEYLAGKYNL